jgi:hypothetical protein
MPWWWNASNAILLLASKLHGGVMYVSLTRINGLSMSQDLKLINFCPEKRYQ